MPTPTVMNSFKLGQVNGAHPIDFDTDTIKAVILTNAYSFSQAHEFLSDINANEVSGAGYTAGGIALAGKTVALDGNAVEFAHNDLTIAQNAAGFANGRHWAWIKDTGVAATSPLIMIMTEASDFGNVAGDLILDADPATGVLRWP